MKAHRLESLCYRLEFSEKSFMSLWLTHKIRKAVLFLVVNFEL